MASVFTYDPDPPKLSSPWPARPVSGLRARQEEQLYEYLSTGTSLVADLADCGITRLQAEPQDGPTEYKLHLLLRPRRSYVVSSTAQRVSGSHQSKPHATLLDPSLEMRQMTLPLSPIPSSQSRQNRLQHLTTQLLWRLQQSSPYHSSSKSDLVIPVLPQAEANLLALGGPRSLLPGLEESQGALYEIGVSDDGSLVGLTQDELEESLTTLRAMAFSLGCKVKVLRMVIVGDCQWKEEAEPARGISRRLHHEKLWIAEALVTPELDFCRSPVPTVSELSCDFKSGRQTNSENPKFEKAESQSEQLRVSLTGSTTSGKSSLLGTLSISTLDNGRGKSRLSLLKHRHEIVSGVSSSVTPELIGYHDSISARHNDKSGISVINYASGNVSSWNDIHSASEPGRLVLMIDSAGHPRYRRTMMRSLMSWAPHWTICCIAADGRDDSIEKAGANVASQKATGCIFSGLDSSRAHLNLCLKLNLPLVVVVTKLDLASRTGLRQILNKVLSLLKSAGRRPCLLPTSTTQDQDLPLRMIATADEEAITQAIASFKPSEISTMVPIILTSTVNGAGISNVHALLRHLPIPQLVKPRNHDLQGQSCTTSLFHIDEVFSITDNQSQLDGASGRPIPGIVQGTVLSGHLRCGVLCVGDHLFIGPFALNSTGNTDINELYDISNYPGNTERTSHCLRILKDQDRLSYDETSGPPPQLKRSSHLKDFWQKVSVVSLRNLRLPVRKLLAGQVGSVGIAWEDDKYGHNRILSNRRVRKGMVLIRPSAGIGTMTPPSYCGFVAIFEEEHGLSLAPGILVIAYVASIRAPVKILSVKSSPDILMNKDRFFFDGNRSDESDTVSTAIPAPTQQEVTFQLMASREWIELGAQVLVMAGNGPSPGSCERGETDGGSLNGFVGSITRLVE